MEPIISARNAEVKPEIFLPGMAWEINALLQCNMGKRAAPPPRKIYLQEWMDRADVGPTELGREASCGQSYVSNLAANRKKNPNVLYLLKISEYLGVTVNDLYLPPPPAAQLVELQRYSAKARETILNLPKRKR